MSDSRFTVFDGGSDWRHRTPAMIGDSYGGTPLGFRSNAVVDRLVVLANDLDSPAVLPAGNSVLTITEAGPVGVFSTTLQSAQQLQTLLRNGSPVPPATLVGTVNANATLTTTATISQIQTQVAGTAQAFDIVAIQAPPGSYTNGVNTVFVARNGVPGTTTYNASTSGAFIQGGLDTLNGGEDLDAYYFFDYVVRFNAMLADAMSGGVGRMKISDGGTVLPQDRVFFRYNYLDNVQYSNRRQNLNRFVPGFEKTLLDRMMSIELRARRR